MARHNASVYTELQLKMRFASLHLQLKRVAHEQNTRLAVTSRAQQTNELLQAGQLSFK